MPNSKFGACRFGALMPFSILGIHTGVHALDVHAGGGVHGVHLLGIIPESGPVRPGGTAVLPQIVHARVRSQRPIHGTKAPRTTEGRISKAQTKQLKACGSNPDESNSSRWFHHCGQALGQ